MEQHILNPQVTITISYECNDPEVADEMMYIGRIIEGILNTELYLISNVKANPINMTLTINAIARVSEDRN